MADIYGEGDAGQDPYVGATGDEFSSEEGENLRLFLDKVEGTPYYDDYDELKQFVKILFQPGRAVQARELTQIQTMLQDQINRFGSHVFKDGSSLQGGGIASVNCFFVRVDEVTGGSIEDFVGYNVNMQGAETTSPVAKVLHVIGPGDDDVDPWNILFLEYVGGDDIFAGEEVLVSDNPAFISLTCQVRESGTDMEDYEGVFTTGESTLVSIDEGIYFMGGYFIKCKTQTIPLYSISRAEQTEDTLITGLGLDNAPANVRLFSTPTAKVGLNISASIVTSDEDESLKDPANGFYNYNAPGADRLKIDPSLVQIPYIYTAEVNTSVATYGDVTKDFIELIRLENGVTTWQRKNPIYNELGDTMARRTHDESGSYTVRPFECTIKNHLRDDSYTIYCNTNAIGTGTDATEAATDATDSTAFSTDVEIGDVLRGTTGNARGTVFGVKEYIYEGTGDDPYPNSDTVINIKMKVYDAVLGEDIISGERLFADENFIVEGKDLTIITTDEIVFVPDGEGSFTFGQGGDEDLMACEVGPGKAYIMGYEHETLSTRTLPLSKGRDTDSLYDYNVVTNIGNYVNVTFPTHNPTPAIGGEGGETIPSTSFGLWDPVEYDITKHPVLNLHNNQYRTIEFPFVEEDTADGECIFWAPLRAVEHNTVYDSVMFVGKDPAGDPSVVACNDGSDGCFEDIYNTTITGKTTGASYKVKHMSTSPLRPNIRRIVFSDLYNENTNFVTIQDLMDNEGLTQTEAETDERIRVYQMNNGIVEGNTGSIIAEGLAERWVPASATGNRMGSVLFVREIYGDFQYTNDTGNTEIGTENTGGVIFQRGDNLMAYGSSIKEVKEIPFVQQVTSVEDYSDTEVGTYLVGDLVRQSRTVNGVLYYATGTVIGVGQVAGGAETCDKIRVWIDADGNMNDAIDKFQVSSETPATYDNVYFQSVGALVKIDDDGSTCIPYHLAEEIVMGEESTGAVQQILFREPYIGTHEFIFNEEIMQYNPYHAGTHSYGDPGAPGFAEGDASQRDIVGTVISWNTNTEWANIYVMKTQNSFDRDYGCVYQQSAGTASPIDPDLGRYGWVGITSVSEQHNGFFINFKDTYGGLGDIPDYLESETVTQIKVDVNGTNYLEGKDYIIGSTVSQYQTFDGGGTYTPTATVISWEHRDPNDATDTRSSLLTVRMINPSDDFGVGTGAVGADQQWGRIIDTTEPTDFGGDVTDNQSGYEIATAYFVRKVIGTARLRQFAAKDNDEYYAYFYDINMDVFQDTDGRTRYFEFKDVNEFWTSSDPTGMIIDRIIPATENELFEAHSTEGYDEDGRLKIVGGTGNRAIFRLPVGDVASAVTKADYRIQDAFEVNFYSSNTVIIETDSENKRFIGGNSINVVEGLNLEHYLLIEDNGKVIDLSSDDITLKTNNNEPSANGKLTIIGDSDSGLAGTKGLLITTLDINPGANPGQGGGVILSDYRKKSLASGSSTVTLKKDIETRQWIAKIPQSDLQSLTNIKDSSNNIVTDKFEFSDGITDNLYDWGEMILKPEYIIDGVPDLPKDGDLIQLTSYYTYFNHTGSGPFFVDSYTHDEANMEYDDIPVYISKQTGDAYPLNTVVDFRPVRSSDGTIGEVWMPKSGEAFDISYSYYLGRYDKLVISNSGDFMIIEGIPSLYPVAPDSFEEVMDLYEIKIPPYTYSPDDVKLKFIENKRYTMRDIGSLEKRISSLEYYTSLSLLEKQTEDMFIADPSGNNRFKLGTLVDNFVGHSVGDVRNVDYSCSMDRSNNILRSRFNSFNFDFVLDESVTPSNSLIKTEDNLYHIPYTHEILLYQPAVSTKFNLNPFDIIDWQGKLNLNPSQDNWVDTKMGAKVRVNLAGENDNWDSMGPLAMGTDYNDWQTNWTGSVQNQTTQQVQASFPAQTWGWGRPTPGSSTITRTTTTTSQRQSRTGIKNVLVPERVTKSLGNRVVDVSIAKYIRARTLTITAQGMKPNTTVYPFFDDTPISEFCTHSSSSIAGKGIVTDDNGSITNLKFNIPEGQFLTGERVFKLIDNSNNEQQLVTTSAEAEFTATGLVQTKSAVSVTTRTFKLVKSNVREERTNISSSATSSVSVGQGTPGGRPTGGGIPWRPYPGGGGNVINRPRPGGRPCPRPNFLSRPRAGIVSGGACGRVFPRRPTRVRRRGRVGRHRRSGRPIRQRDPLAQSFFISAEEHPDGVYLTKIEFWFANKGDVPVALQLRPMVNGYPHSSAVLPFGEIIKPASEVVASTDIPSVLDTAVATSFEFPTPVHLVAGQEYAMVLIANSIEYEMYGSTMGQTDLLTGDIISKQPTLGSLFKSQNSMTWEADQKSDMMYVIHVAEFDTSTIYETVYREDTTIPEYSGEIAYDLFNMSVNVVEHPTAAIEWLLADTPNSVGGLISDIYQPFQTGKNEKLASAKKINLDNDDPSLRIKVKMQTDNPDVSPMIDMERFGFIAINNTIDNNYNTDITSGNYNGELDPVAALSEEASGVKRSRYISRMVRLEEGFDASNIQVILTANQPSGTTVQVFMKYQKGSDDRPFDKIGYTLLESDAPDFVSENDTDYTELQYKLSEDTTETFQKFAIKIVMYSNNTSVIPTIKDLRAISVL